MELSKPIPLPAAASIQAEVQAEQAIAEIERAIELVVRGVARRVHVTGLAGLEDVAGQGLAAAQAAGVRFALVRDVPDSVSAIVGPREE